MDGWVDGWRRKPDFRRMDDGSGSDSPVQEMLVQAFHDLDQVRFWFVLDRQFELSRKFDNDIFQFRCQDERMST